VVHSGTVVCGREPACLGATSALRHYYLGAVAERVVGWARLDVGASKGEAARLAGVTGGAGHVDEGGDTTVDATTSSCVVRVLQSDRVDFIRTGIERGEVSTLLVADAVLKKSTKSKPIRAASMHRCPHSQPERAQVIRPLRPNSRFGLAQKLPR
jgi:hypothetical protein